MAVREIELLENVPKERSLWQKSLRRLLRNKVAVISGIFIIFMLLAAIFAGQLTPYYLCGAGLAGQ